MITTLPSIAILIDCWKSPKANRPLENCYDRIINFLNTTDSIQTVVLSSYNCNSEHINSEYLWYQNNTLMCDESTRKKIHHLKHAHDFLRQYDNKFIEEQTDPLILRYLNPKKYQISMLWWWELEYYLSLHPEIKNIYFLGQSWEECIRNRPLGFKSVLEETTNLNILTNDQCVMRQEHSAPQLDLSTDPEWIHIEGNIYQYKITSC